MVDESGQGQVDTIMKVFEEDDLVDTLKERLVGVVSDGKNYFVNWLSSHRFQFMSYEFLTCSAFPAV